MGNTYSKYLTEIDRYFRSDFSDLPLLEFTDKDGDGNIDLMDSYGNDLIESQQEIHQLWAHILKGIAINHVESENIELSRQDWETHLSSLNQSESGRVVLPNGLQVSVEYNSSKKFIYVGYAVFVGGIDETPELRGISHGLEHVLSGSPPFGTRKDLDDHYTSLIGQHFRANTNFDRTYYGFQVIPENIEEAFSGLDSTLMNNKFNPQNVEDEITSVLAMEIQRGLSDPWRMAGEVFRAQISPVHPYGDNVIGTLEKTQAMNLEVFSQYHENYYVPNNTAIKFYGPITLSEAIEIVKNSKIGQASPAVVERPLIEPNPPREHPTFEIIESGDGKITATEISEIQVAYPIPDWQDRKYRFGLEMAMDIINSILQYELVKTGKVNSASLTEEGLVNTSFIYLTIYGQADELPEAYAFARRVIHHFTQFRPNIPNVTRKQREWQRNFLESEGDLQGYLRYSRYLNDLIDQKIFLEQINAVKPKDVLKASQLYLDFTAHNPHTQIVLQQGFSKEQFLKNMVDSTLTQPLGSEIYESYRLKKIRYAPIPKNIDLNDVLAEPFQVALYDRIDYVLPNGIRVHYLPNEHAKKVTSHLRVKKGDIADPLGLEGLKHVFNKHFLRGSDAFLITHLTNTGADYDISYIKGGFKAELEARENDYIYALELWLDALYNPSFDPAETDYIKQEIDLDRQDDFDDYEWIARHIPWKSVFGDQDWQRPIKGSNASLERITTNDLQTLHKIVFDPQDTDFYISGISFENLKKVLYLLSQIPPLDTEPKLRSLPEEITNSYDIPLVKLSKNQIRNLGLDPKYSVVTWTEKDITQSYITSQRLGPQATHPDYPYYFLFTRLLENRNFYRLVSGQKEGRTNSKGYLYTAHTNSNNYESEEYTNNKYTFDCTPGQVARVLSDYHDEYKMTIGPHKPSDDELEIVQNKYLISELKRWDNDWGLISAELDRDSYPWYFYNDEGSIDEVRDPIEVLERLRTITINDIIDIGSKYFSPNQPTYIHIVGSDWK